MELLDSFIKKNEMKNFLFVLIFVFPIFVNAQGFSKKEVNRLEKVLKRSNSQVRGFDPKSLVSVERMGNDELEGMVENALFTAGFEVVSNKTALDAVNISNPLDSSNSQIEISRTQSYNAVYVVTVSGEYYEGPLIGKCQYALITFTARIVDLKDEGRLVGTFKYSGNALTFVACVEDVANALAYRLEESTKQ